MEAQFELFPRPSQVIQVHATDPEPRLWIQRLVIWEKPGVVLRDIRLRRGLNIIYSPDPGVESALLGHAGGSGHGAGKSLFCRLIRYCLGEETFATSDVRMGVARELPDGLVGIEAVINGRNWAVIRQLGTVRHQLVRPEVSLEELVEETDVDTSMREVAGALDGLMAESGVGHFVANGRPHASWLFTLAWLTRDQECRFGHLLDWRHTRTESKSPVLGMSKEDMTVAVRCLLGVLDRDEVVVRGHRERIGEKRKEHERTLNYRQRRAEQLRAEIAGALDVEVDSNGANELELDAWRVEAERRLSDVDGATPAEAQRSKVAELGQRRDVVLAGLAVLEDELGRLKATRTMQEEQVRFLNGERSNLSAEEIRARLGPACPVCRVPIEQALAEGCKLSNAFRDPAEVARAQRTNADQITECQTVIHAFGAEIADCQRKKSLCEVRQAETDAQIAALESEIDRATREHRKTWSACQRLVEKVDELRETLNGIAQGRRALEADDADDALLREQQAELREAHKGTVTRLNDLFGYVCRAVLGDSGRTSLTLTGLGIQAEVEVGGTAMESFKTIAFDLAALLLSMEGRAALPAFLIHDSPREADLGASIYHKWFQFVAGLEELAAEPPFQYIITSTSAPPAELINSKFVVAELQGAEPGERLLRRELR
jgi:hypothetical protein